MGFGSSCDFLIGLQKVGTFPVKFRNFPDIFQSFLDFMESSWDFWKVSGNFSEIVHPFATLLSCHYLLLVVLSILKRYKTYFINSIGYILMLYQLIKLWYLNVNLS